MSLGDHSAAFLSACATTCTICYAIGVGVRHVVAWCRCIMIHAVPRAPVLIRAAIPALIHVARLLADLSAIPAIVQPVSAIFPPRHSPASPAQPVLEA